MNKYIFVFIFSSICLLSIIYAQSNYENSIAHQLYPKAAFKRNKLPQIVSDFQVNENVKAEGTAKDSPAIATDKSGNFIITWCDVRSDSLGDIYVQRYLNIGEPVGTNFRVNDDKGIFVQNSPSICCADSGSFVITWKDGRAGSDIYAQCYSFNGTVLGNNFKVNEDVEDNNQLFPAIACDKNGNFVIVWMDEREDGYVLYGQRYLNTGTPIGKNFRIKDDGVNDLIPAITCDNEGDFVITWSAKRHNGYAVLAKKYLKDGSAVGRNYEVHLDERGDSSPSVDLDEFGRFMIAWEDVNHDGNSNIYAQRYSNHNEPIEENFRVNDDIGTAAQFNPSVAADESGNYVIAWADRRKDDHDIYIYAQRYLSDGSPLGSNFQIARYCYGQQNYPDVKMNNNYIYTTWIDNNANGTGYNIWANVLNWAEPLTSSSTSQLRQNYPNPVVNETYIEYDLLEDGDVQLCIYNIIGQLVYSLVHINQHVNYYKFIWDRIDQNGQKVANGVYFYFLKVNGKISDYKKIVVIE